MTRREWRETWRVIRIARRECEKALQDTMLFGVGFTRVNQNGVVHVSPKRALDSAAYLR